MILTTTAIVTLCLLGMPGDTFIDAGRGPVAVEIPAGYDGTSPTPIVMLLHGYSSNGNAVEAGSWRRGRGCGCSCWIRS